MRTFLLDAECVVSDQACRCLHHMLALPMTRCDAYDML